MLRHEMKAAVVGGGLVGLLDACYLSRSGFTVDVYEKYDDPRTLTDWNSRTINLTLSHRGKIAVDKIGLLDTVLQDSVPTYGRVVWSGEGSVLGETEYGEKAESFETLRRTDLVLRMLEAAESYANVKVHFKHELSQCDFEAGTAKFIYIEDGEKMEKVVCADLFIGADGAHSAMRAEMQKYGKMDFVDFKYHDHCYVELRVPSNGKSQLNKNRLHVWPKVSFLLVCLPNHDNSYTGILVLPKPLFDQILESDDSLIAFFKKEFSQVLDMVGEKNLIQQFQPGKPEGRQPSRLVSLKCQPYHASSTSGTKFVLHGDAAHVMLPFYGQGMDTGFEDVKVFHAILHKHGYTKEGIYSTLEEFSNDRCKDGQAMVDFSYDQYEALRSNVWKKNYTARRHIDSALHKIFPDKWIPEYTLVAFSSVPQSQCREIVKRQDEIISDLTMRINSWQLRWTHTAD